jgi:hypothetical protein
MQDDTLDAIPGAADPAPIVPPVPTPAAAPPQAAAPSPAPVAPPAAPATGPSTSPPVKNLTAKEVLRNVEIYALLIAAYLVPLLALSYMFASQAEWYAVRRLPELTACLSFDKLHSPHEGHEWLRFWNKPTFPQLEGKLEFSLEVKANDHEQARIKSQHEELLNRIRHHGSALSKLFGIYTSSVIMTGITSAVAAILLLFITASGWNNAHNYAKATFLVAVATAGYYVAFPKIFLLDDNMTANREHYLAYIALADEICSYAATGQGYVLNEPSSSTDTHTAPSEQKKSATAQKDKTNPSDGNAGEILRQRHADPAAFIAYMDYELKHWNTVAVGFDSSKNPDFRKLFDEWLKTK